MADYYRILKLEPSADEAEVKKAFNREMRVWSNRTNAPQMERRQEAERMVKLLQEAEGVLLNPAKRAEYDRSQQGSRGQSKGGSAAAADRSRQREEATPPPDRDEDASSLIQQGWHLLIDDRIEEALEVATRATELEPTNADAWALLGQAKFRSGDIDDAIYEYKRAIKLRSSEASYYGDLGSIYESIERWDEAVQQYERAAQIDPKTTMYRAAIGIVQVKMGNLEKAIGILERCVAEEPDNQSYQHALGYAYLDGMLSGWWKRDEQYYCISEEQALHARAMLEKARALRFDDAELKGQLEERGKFVESMFARQFKGSWAMVILLGLCYVVPGVLWWWVNRRPVYKINRDIHDMVEHNKVDAAMGGELGAYLSALPPGFKWMAYKCPRYAVWIAILLLSPVTLLYLVYDNYGPKYFAGFAGAATLLAVIFGATSGHGNAGGNRVPDLQSINRVTSTQPIADHAHSRITTASSAGRDNPATVPGSALPQINQKPLDTSLGISTGAPNLRDGYSIPEKSLSPDKRYGILVPNAANFKEGQKGQNKVIDLKSGNPIVTIDAESWFQDPSITMNHGGAAAIWSKDGKFLAWAIAGKWTPRAFNVLKVTDGNAQWQVNVLTAVQREILRATHDAAPEAYEAAKRENIGNGSAYPDGFTIDVEVPDSPFSLPLACRVRLDSNPKHLEQHISLESSLLARIFEDGAISISGFKLHSSGGSPLGSTSESDVRAFITDRIATEHSRDLNRIMGQYAERVSYWDNGTVNQDFIRKDKSDYFASWPRSGEELIGPIEISHNGDAWTARFRLKFQTESPAKRIARDGLMEITYSVQLFDGRLKVVSEVGKLLQQNKRTLSQQPGTVLNGGGPDGNRMPGERFPETRLRAVSANDLNPLSIEAIRYAINEMYARHGADFSNEDIKKTFSKFPWYLPQRGKSYDAAEAEFSEIEKRNVDLLGNYRNALKNGVPPQPGLPPIPQTIPQKPAHKASRYDGHGQIYKIPELKNLVGQRLKNAWLYGPFVYRSHSGNTLIAVTGTRFILVKEGTTEVSIECVGGFTLRPETVEFFRTNLGQPPAPVFDVPQSDPLELLRVEKATNGRLRVQARYHGNIRL